MDNLICEHNMDIDEYKNYIEEAKISISRIDELNVSIWTERTIIIPFPIIWYVWFFPKLICHIKNEVLNKINNIREQLTEVQQANARKEAQIAQQTMSRDQVMDINIKRKTVSLFLFYYAEKLITSLLLLTTLLFVYHYISLYKFILYCYVYTYIILATYTFTTTCHYSTYWGKCFNGGVRTWKKFIGRDSSSVMLVDKFWPSEPRVAPIFYQGNKWYKSNVAV